MQKDGRLWSQTAAAYIKQLKERVDALKRRKEGGGGREGGAAAGAVRMPVVEVRCQDGATLDAVLISEAGRPLKLHEVMTALEEGAEVVSASFSVVADKIFYTIHSQALNPRIGLDAARVSERLHDLLLLV
ncbi:hypothetical protein PVAP13_5NG151881 [Panicum virgatum]|uniref:Uncharacterized protein n=1 Tax=Panicum virgatum TaxID=38727 RepID=A0A8T0RRR9_PANVG|nr:hypothetical protein PVAP13_5NG151881 [Panicum virgatum]